MKTWNIEQPRKELERLCQQFPLAHQSSLDESLAIINRMTGTNWVLFYPGYAADQLAKYRGINRSPKRKQIPSYAADMRAKKWRINPEPFVYLENGNLGNGQNRAEAVELSGTACFFAVVRNAPVNVMEVLDTGVPRSTPDTLKISGFDAGQQEVGVVRQVVTGLGSGTKRNLSNQEIRHLIEKHRPAITLAITGCPRQFRQAAWQAVLTRAYYHVDGKIERLQKFKEALFNGSALAEEQAVNTLRNYLTNVKSYGGQSHRSTVYAFTETVMDYFLRGEPLLLKNPNFIPDKYLTRYERFPIPGEDVDFSELSIGSSAIESRKRSRKRRRVQIS